MGYHLIVFRIRPHKFFKQVKNELPGVSVVIAVKNGSDALIQNLDAFLSQDYPAFEIVIVDDHSTSEEKQKLTAAITGHELISLYHSDGSPGKKQALSDGIEKAKYPLILCTDADCCPGGESWIKSMVSHGKDNNVVLGFSPYKRNHGLLNFFVRFETVMTAIQFFSWAVMKRPYMGVGRNMLFPKQLFEEIKPFKDHDAIPYGDDDLIVQQLADVAEVSVCVDMDSFTYSDAPVSWPTWFRQKHRHMSAGHHYKLKAWWRPGIFGIVLIGHWFLIPFLLIGHVQGDLWFFLLAGWMIRWITYIQWTQRLGEKDTRIVYPLAEVMYALYLAAMGLITLVAKKKTWN